MCSICMCEHQNERHGTNGTHITSLIHDVLAQVGKLIEKPEEQQRQIKEYNKSAEELITAKEAIRLKLEEKLENLRAVYKKHKALVAYHNAAILKCHETILKETQDGEHKLKESMKDPKRIERRVKEMVQREDYWVAYEEAKQALGDNTHVDDRQIKAEFAKCDMLLKAYQEQLMALDITSFDSTKYNKLLEDNAGLLGENQKISGITVMGSYNIGELEKCKKTMQVNKKNMEQLIAAEKVKLHEARAALTSKMSYANPIRNNRQGAD